MVDSIMEAERSTVTRMEQRIDAAEEERQAWLEVGRRISNLQAASRLLFGFENPFHERVAHSSDEAALIATADRNAPEGTTRVAVRQLAEADRFISRNLPADFQVDRGRYGFRVGESEVFFTFQGGSLEAFAQTVNQRAGDLVSARVVRNTANTRVILIEAKQTGADFPLSFLQDARPFALEAGILKEVRDSVVRPPIQASTVTGTTPADSRTVSEGTLTVAPGGNAAIRLPVPVPSTESMVMELEINVRDLYEPWTPPERPPGPRVPDPDGVTLGDVTVESAPSTVPLPEWEEPPPPEVREDLELLYLRAGQTSVALPELRDTDGFQTLRVPLAEHVGRLDAIEIRNRNTHREISVRGITVYDPRAREDVAPLNPISTASDAIVEIDGIEVIRPTNSIDDLIDGVTLTLRRPTVQPVELLVEPDREQVTDALIQFLFYYNELMREINILTRSDTTIVDELTNYTREEREEALARLGLLQGNLALNSLKSRMQTVMMNPYPTDAGNQLSLLAQVGISTNQSGPGSGFEAGRMRGYMEMSPREVGAALRTQFIAVRQLFGNDTDGDRAIDSGVAFELERSLRPYTQTGGLIATRTGGISRSISDTRSRIEREEVRLAQVEARYRADFARMEAALRQMRDSEQSLETLRSQTGNR